MFVNALQLYYNRHFKDMVHRGSTSKSPKRTLPMPVYPPAKKSRKASSSSAPAAWSEAEVLPKNLMMLSNAACPMQKGKTYPNWMCHDMSHSKNGKKFIQKHTCKYCLAARINELLQKEHLHHWDAVNIIMREFRRYFCGFCLLRAFKTKDFSAISLGKKCFNGHGAISSMRCCDHGREFKYCKVCKDPRAGGRYKACCGGHFTVKCDCKAVVSGEVPMAAAEIAEKDAWVEACLDRAQKMQAAGAITPKRRVVVVRTYAKPSIEEVLMQGVSGGALAAVDDTRASFAAAVLGGLKKGADLSGESDATTTTTPSVSAFGSTSGASSAFGSPSGASSHSGASSSFGSPLATISIQALVEPPTDLPANYETESDGDMWVVDDRTESDSE